MSATGLLALALAIALGACLGAWLSARREQVRLENERASRARAGAREEVGKKTLVFDSSAIIDGRAIGWLGASRDPRPVVVPSCVVDEIEFLSRSADPDRRRRGELGLRHLASLTSRAPVDRAATSPGGLHQPGGVDAALLEFATSAPGLQLVTMDAELARRAEAQGIETIEVGVLANAFTGRYSRGNLLEVVIDGRGRKPDQGMAILDDGARVFVEDGARLIGESVAVEVTSISRTKSGRVLFARLVDRPVHEIAGASEDAT